VLKSVKFNIINYTEHGKVIDPSERETNNTEISVILVNQMFYLIVSSFFCQQILVRTREPFINTIYLTNDWYDF
jgi:hypothetical protein